MWFVWKAPTGGLLKADACSPSTKFANVVTIHSPAAGGAMLAALPGIAVNGGRIAVNAHGFTGRAKWYAGGDCVNGGKEVVNAAAEGKAAALAIHAVLSGGASHA